MKDQKQELIQLIDTLSETQIGYLLTLVNLINRLTVHQTRYLLAFVKKRFSL